MKKLINTKDWGHSVYEAYIDLDGDYQSIIDKVTGVVTICFDENDKVVLMGSEPLGGHVEQGESIEQALQRESLEEGGIQLSKYKYFGYYEIKLKDMAEQKYKDKYPKLGYILFFIAKGHHIMEPYGKDVISNQLLDIDYVLNSGKFSHEMLLEGVKLYPRYFD